MQLVPHNDSLPVPFSPGLDIEVSEDDPHCPISTAKENMYQMAVNLNLILFPKSN